MTPPTSPNLTVIKVAPLDWGGLVINIGNKNGEGNPPYSNVGTPLAQSPKLRQAFEEAINRSTISRIAYSGVRKPSCTLIPTDDTEWYSQTKVPCTPYDPKDAKKLVADRDTRRRSRCTFFVVGGNAGGGGPGHPVGGGRGRFQRRHRLPRSGRPTRLLTKWEFRRDGERSVADRPRPEQRHLPLVRQRRRGEHRRLLQPAPRLRPRQRAQGDRSKARAVDYRVAQQIVHADRPIIVLRETIPYAIFDSDLSGIQLSPFGVMLLANAQYK